MSAALDFSVVGLFCEDEELFDTEEDRQATEMEYPDDDADCYTPSAQKTSPLPLSER